MLVCLFVCWKVWSRGWGIFNTMNMYRKTLSCCSACTCSLQASVHVFVLYAWPVSVCVSQRCSKDREWWSGRLMDIILMGSSSTTIRAIRAGKRRSEDWWWWTWSDCYHSDPWTNEHSTYCTDHHLHWTLKWFFTLEGKTFKGKRRFNWPLA